MTSSNQFDTTTVALLVIAAILAVPLLTMSLGFGGMMGYGGMMPGYEATSGWWPIVGLVVPLGMLFALLAGGYLVVQRMNDSPSADDPAIEELRLAYARGDLSEEEFEARRERLDDAE